MGDQAGDNDAPAPRPTETKDAEASPAKKSFWRNPKTWSAPRWVLTTAAAAAIASALGYYLPGVFKSAAKPVAPFTITVVDNSQPPLVMMVPPARTATGNPGPPCPGFRSWALANGGIDAGDTKVDLLVQGTSSTEAVVILGIRAQVVSHSAAMQGTVVECQPAGNVPINPVKINLDAAGQGQLIRSAPGEPFNKFVTSTDPEDFSVDASTSSALLAWDLVVEASVRGRIENLVVTDNGKPFETTPKPAAARGYEWEGSNWIPVNARGIPTGPAVPLGTALPAS